MSKAHRTRPWLRRALVPSEREVPEVLRIECGHWSHRVTVDFMVLESNLTKHKI